MRNSSFITLINKIIISLFFLLFFSCSYYSNFTAYYNTYFNAKKSYELGVKDAQKLRLKNKKSVPKTNRNFNSAIEKCWKIIEYKGYKNAYADDAVLMIIKSEYYLGKYTSAEEHIKAFKSKFPNSDLIAEINLWNGKCLLQEKDTVKSLNILNETLDYVKNKKIKAEIYLELAEISFAKKNYGNSVKMYELALKEAENKIQKATIQFNLAESYYNSKNYKNAAKIYEKVLELAPTTEIEFNTKYNYCSALSKQEKHDKALEILKKMLTAKRFTVYYTKIYSLIGKIYLQKDDLTSSFFYLKKGFKVKRGEGSALCAFALGEIFENILNDIDSAVYYYSNVNKFDRNSDLSKEANEKYKFLGDLSKIKNKVIYEENLLLKLNNDAFFRDSLKDAQIEDSIFQINRAKKTFTFRNTLKKLIAKDTIRLYYFPEMIKISEEYEDDSLRISLKLDSLETDYKKDTLVYLDTIRYKKTDKVATTFFSFNKEIKQLKKTKATSVEKRKIPEIKNDLKQHIIDLGDFYLLETKLIDSAKVVFERFTNQYEDSTLSPKALYSLSYIYKNYYDNKDKSEQLLTSIQQKYPHSYFAKRINKSKKKVHKPKKQHNDKYLHAENMLFNNKIDSSVVLFKKIAKNDTSDEWRSKAAYALAFIYEKKKLNIDSALHYYTELANNFANTEYGKKAKLKISKEVTKAKPKESSTIVKDKPKEVIKTKIIVYNDSDKKRIINTINHLIQEDQKNAQAKGQLKRFWSKKVLHEFLNQF